jgi:hypothetical protein
MALIAVVALGFSSLRAASPHWVNVVFALTVATLLVAAMRAILTPSPTARRWWSGFSLFGWAHLLLAGSQWWVTMPTQWLMHWSMESVAAEFLPFPTRGPGYTNAMHAANGEFYLAATSLASLYLTLMIALVGGLLTGWLATRAERRDSIVNETSSAFGE